MRKLNLKAKSSFGQQQGEYKKRIYILGLTNTILLMADSEGMVWQDNLFYTFFSTFSEAVRWNEKLNLYW